METDMARPTNLIALLLVSLTWTSAKANEPDMEKVREMLAMIQGKFKAVAFVASGEIPGVRTAESKKGNYVVAQETYESGPNDDGKFTVNIVEGWDPSTRTIKQVMFGSEGGNSTTLFKIVDNRLVGLRSGIEADGTRWTANVEIKPVTAGGFDLHINKWRTDTGEERPDIKVEFRP
jgi:hypothetical protein